MPHKIDNPNFWTPGVEGLFADAHFPADILDLAARSIRFPEDADLFFGRGSHAFHFLGPL
jgi:hypothetical protein|tara:strand:- start:179 stop:358 length:180 start_codon:yes stop_codon:yes gene_type:complete